MVGRLRCEFERHESKYTLGNGTVDVKFWSHKPTNRTLKQKRNEERGEDNNNWNGYLRFALELIRER